MKACSPCSAYGLAVPHSPSISASGTETSSPGSPSWACTAHPWTSVHYWGPSMGCWQASPVEACPTDPWLQKRHTDNATEHGTSSKRDSKTKRTKALPLYSICLLCCATGGSTVAEEGGIGLVCLIAGDFWHTFLLWWFGLGSKAVDDQHWYDVSEILHSNVSATLVVLQSKLVDEFIDFLLGISDTWCCEQAKRAEN